jgi:hypothetical protein
MILPEARSDGLIDVEKVISYILERQNVDGGYTFCRGAESNAQDTYYALKILEMLDVEPRNRNDTIHFLQSLQRDDGSFDSIKCAYYVTCSLVILEGDLPKPIGNLQELLNTSIKGIENPNIDVEVVSEVENVYLVVELCRMLGLDVDSERVIDRVLTIKNDDGSFGSEKRSKMASTYYALEVLKVLGYGLHRTSETLAWIRERELASGGFVTSPELFPIYLEDTYFGAKALAAFGEKLRYPAETARLVAKFQNPNGGFRRSIFIGISEFESTYQAISLLRMLQM